MKIKRNLYCLTDNNNKPDYRFLFEDLAEAKKKIQSIKNATQGETLFVSQKKRDFFVDGIKKSMLDPYRNISIKRGCWTGLKVKQLNLLDTIEPERFFKQVVRDENMAYSFSKQHDNSVTFQNPTFDLPSIPNPFLTFDWENTFLRTKSFAFSISMLFISVITGVLALNYHASNVVAKRMMDSQSNTAQKLVALQAKVTTEKTTLAAKNQADFDDELNNIVVGALQKFASLKQEEYQGEIQRMLAGSPMEQMTPFIAQQDRTVAAFLIGIAKKESNLGQHVPVLNGQDCFNYWGYRGIRSRMGTGGHTCFDSPQDAVDTVAGRIRELVQADVDTPQEMVLWKCGSACSRDAQAGKWIHDVSLYFNKFKNADQGNG